MGFSYIFSHIIIIISHIIFFLSFGGAIYNFGYVIGSFNNLSLRLFSYLSNLFICFVVNGDIKMFIDQARAS